MGLYTRFYNRWLTSHIAIVDEQQEYTYAMIDTHVRSICSFFHQCSIQKGDVIAVQLPKSVLLLEVILAGLAYGCPVLPLNDKYTQKEAQFYVDDAQARIFIGTQEFEHVESITDHGLLRSLAPMISLPEVEDDSLAILLYTSGTTGIPKGAMISHSNILATVKGLYQSWGFSGSDRLLHMLPLFHVHGLFVAQFVALYACCTSIWMRSFQRDMCLSLLETEKVTVMMAVPTIYFRILEKEETVSFSSLRLCTSGSAPLPVPIHNRFERMFGMSIVERYGMTEVGIVLSNPYDGLRKVGTVGLPVSGAQLQVTNPETHEPCRVGETGELWISGPSVISGYLRRPEQTSSTFVGEWLRSGDLAVQDEDGYIRIAGRCKDLVISGGLNIYPLEVEAIFLGHPLVEQVAGVGVPDLEWGEKFVMQVIGKEGLCEEELKQFAREKLASYKRPKAYFFVDSFPRNAMGKVQKAKIRQQLKRDLGIE